MAVVAVLALIAFISPVSAVSIGDHEITFVSHTFDGTYSTWTYNVTSGSQPAISHWSIAWCNPDAIVKVSDEPWVYVTDIHTGIKGIKFENGYDDGESRIVWFKLRGDFPEDDCVNVSTKAGGGKNEQIDYGCVKGPVRCDVPIPEFTTSAIPVAAILGLMFFFNHRKQRKAK